MNYIYPKMTEDELERDRRKAIESARAWINKAAGVTSLAVANRCHKNANQDADVAIRLIVAQALRRGNLLLSLDADR